MLVCLIGLFGLLSATNYTLSINNRDHTSIITSYTNASLSTLIFERVNNQWLLLLLLFFPIQSNLCRMALCAPFMGEKLNLWFCSSVNFLDLTNVRFHKLPAASHGIACWWVAEQHSHIPKHSIISALNQRVINYLNTNFYLSLLIAINCISVILPAINCRAIMWDHVISFNPMYGHYTYCEAYLECAQTII